MAMTDTEKQEMRDLKELVTSLLEVRNVSFIEEVRRRIVSPTASSLIAQAKLGDLADVTDDATTGEVIKKQADGTWAGAADNIA